MRKDIKEIKRKGLFHLIISISNSTEPLQHLEYVHRHTLYALRLLNEAGLKGLIITKNPSLLLLPPYLEQLREGRFIVQVSIPFIRGNPFETHCPHPSERLLFCRKLLKEGIKLILRIDPLIPNVEGVGQHEEEIAKLLEEGERMGVKFVVAKCLRLLGAMKHYYPYLYKKLYPFYKKEGRWMANAYELSNIAKERLLFPLYKECERRGIELFTCIDKVSFGTHCDPSYRMLSSL